MRVRTWTLAAVASSAALAVLAGWAPAQAPTAPAQAAPAPQVTPATPAPTVPAATVPAAPATPAAPAGQAAPAAPMKPAALVNNEPISLVEVDYVISKNGPQAATLSEGKLRDLRLRTLGMLIDDMLIMQYMRQNGPRVDPTEADKVLAEMQEQAKKQGQNFQDYLRETNQTLDQVRRDITTMLQWRDYLKVRINDGDLKRYYTENKDYFDMVVVRASHIVLRVPANASDGERQATRNRLLALRQEIISGKLDFAEAARKNSQCPSAPSGGDLGFFERKGVVEEAFAKAAFALAPGQVSDVVETDYGLHLIKVTERKPGQPSDFAKITDVVRGAYIRDLREGLLTQLRRTAKLEVNLP